MSEAQTTPAASTPTPASTDTSATPSIPTDPGELATLDAQLTDLHSRSPMEYRYDPQGHAQRHLEVRRALELAGKQQAAAVDKAPDADTADDEAGDEDDPAADYSTDTTEDEKIAAPSDVPDDPDERAEYLPDDASGYAPPAVEGVEWAEADKPTLESFYKAAHELEMPQGHVDRIAGWYVNRVAEIREGWKQSDGAQLKATRATLAKSWGSEFASNLDAANEVWKALPKSFRTQLRSARLIDGRGIYQTPEFSNLLLQAARGRQQGDAAPTLSADEARDVALNKIRMSSIDQYNNERTGRRTSDGRWETLSDEHLAIRRRLDARKRA